MASSSSYSPDAYTTTTIGSLVQALSFRFVGTNEIPYQVSGAFSFLLQVSNPLPRFPNRSPTPSQSNEECTAGGGQSQEEEIPEYLVGVASASIITTGVFILWGFFLLIWQW